MKCIKLYFDFFGIKKRTAKIESAQKTRIYMLTHF